MLNRRPGGFDRLLHPLSQIEAAAAFCDGYRAFVADAWKELYSDPPPSEEALDDIEPWSVLDALAREGLRFELAGYAVEPHDFASSYKELGFGRTALDGLLYGWIHQMTDALEADPRAMHEGLNGEDLIFVPDDGSVASKASFLLLDSSWNDVEQRERAVLTIVRIRRNPDAGQLGVAGKWRWVRLVGDDRRAA